MLASPLARLAAFVVAIVALAAAATAGAAPQTGYVVTPLVSTDGSNGTTPDANLVNAWGLGASGTSPWWVSDNGTGKSTLYTGAGAIVPLVVTVGDAPTGLVFNNTTGFPLPTGGNARFLFDSEAGTITGWNGGASAQLGKDLSSEGAVFKGLAIANTSAGPRLYATDFHNRRVDVFDGAWNRVNSPFQFFDPSIPSNYAPFGIQTIGSLVYVTYAKTQPGSDDEAHGVGTGFVDAFDAATGIVRSKVAIHGLLNAPWGLALAPDGFGEFSGDLLVGNFGDGKITAYRPFFGGHIFLPAGQLRTADHTPVMIDGLWALEFGNGAAAGPLTSLYFTAGPDDESAGLFGSITAAP